AWCRKEPDLLVLRIARNTHQNIKPIVYEREGVGHRLRSLKRSSGDTSKTGRTKRSASLQNRGALAEKWVLQVPLSPFQGGGLRHCRRSPTWSNSSRRRQSSSFRPPPAGRPNA